MTPDMVNLVAPLGVGGIMALAMFLIYRKDAKEQIESWKGQSEILVQVVKENTAALVALKTVIEHDARGASR